MRVIIIIILLFLFKGALSCTGGTDTVIVMSNKFQSVYNNKFWLIRVSNQGDTIFLNFPARKKVDNEIASKMLLKYPYCKIYDRKNRLIEEGIWFGECFTGKYKSYYKNGAKKSDGVYLNNIKVGDWKYYNRNGKIIRQEQFDDEGKLLKAK